MELTGAAMAGGGEPIVSRVGRVDAAADRFEREHEGGVRACFLVCAAEVQ